jgi:RNA polymerase sigma-70 factor (family 1)
MQSPDHNNHQLAERFQNGDKKAFEEIFDRYWYVLYKNAYAVIRSHEEAEEIVQDLFTTLWQKRASLQINSLSDYLYVAMRRRIIDRSRSKLTQAKYWDFYKINMPAYEETTQKMVAFNELNDKLEEVIRKLPEKSQLIFRLNRLEGRSVSEISKFLQLSERAIEYHLTRSLRELRLHLKNFLVLLIVIRTIFF